MRQSIWPHSLIRSWIDPLWGNHRIILCATLKCAPGHVLVLGVGSVIKVHNRMAIMAIRLCGLIPQIMHQPASLVSDHEEGCRWSGECRWLKRREPLWREGARYANILKVPDSFHCSDFKIFHLCYQLGNVSVSKPPHPHSFINYKSILGSGSPGHNISMVTTWKGWLAEWLHSNSVSQENLQLALEHFRWKPSQHCGFALLQLCGGCGIKKTYIACKQL